ncbi:MAG: SDR family oxidoreductase, partial [Negativicutes bacterium]|nr:SDR family oxidoreductase [Negativicutes bacterium]
DVYKRQGYIVTPLNAAELSQEKIYNYITAKIPMKRFGQVHEIGCAAVMLASAASSYMTGQIITIDGGWTAQ